MGRKKNMKIKMAYNRALNSTTTAIWRKRNHAGCCKEEIKIISR
jgi:hypothetical protein